MRKVGSLGLTALAVTVSIMAPTSVAAQSAPAVSPPAPAQVASADAARKALADDIARAIIPDGMMAKIMADQMQNVMPMMMNTRMGLPMSALLEERGLTVGPNARDVPMADVMAVIDPAFEQRMNAVTRVTTDLMMPIMSKIEPGMREGMARAYARDFTAPQLSEIKGFLKSPTGSAFAGRLMAINSDPEMMSQMMGMMPEIMSVIPQMEPKLKAEMDKLPPEPKGPLSADQLRKLEALLGTTVRNAPQGKTKK